MMPRNTTCYHCGDPAITHITDSAVRPVVGFHYCEKHTPNEYRETIDRLALSIWNDPGDRESAIDFIANEVGVARDEVRHALESGFDKLDRRTG